MNNEGGGDSWEHADQILDRILGLDIGVSALRRDIAAYRSTFEADGRETTLPAFQALAQIASWMWSKKPDADLSDDWVEVPWWALYAIAIGYIRYMGSKSDNGQVSFENAFGLAGSKPGEWGAIPRWERRIEQFEVALEVANILQRRGQHRAITVQRAVEIVADHRGLSSSTVWTAWRENRTQARKALQKSSSSSEVRRP